VAPTRSAARRAARKSAPGVTHLPAPQQLHEQGRLAIAACAQLPSLAMLLCALFAASHPLPTARRCFERGCRHRRPHQSSEAPDVTDRAQRRPRPASDAQLLPRLLVQTALIDAMHQGVNVFAGEAASVEHTQRGGSIFRALEAEDICARFLYLAPWNPPNQDSGSEFLSFGTQILVRIPNGGPLGTTRRRTAASSDRPIP
jgi:hypothetical protein